MYLFYVDETGNLDPRLEIPTQSGRTIAGEPLFVLTAVGLYEHRWHGFEKTLNRAKQAILDRIAQDHGIPLDLADFEIKSNWLRIPKERGKHPALSRMEPAEIEGLVDLFYAQLAHHHMPVFSVVIDKRHIPEYMDGEKIHRKAWELLLEQVQRCMEGKYPKHQALFVKDDMTVQANRSLAMKHAHLLDKGTAGGMWLKNICEMPHFVRSELSNGVQLADLCSYNIYRVFKDDRLDYPFFQKMRGAIWSRAESVRHPFSGIRVFPDDSPLWRLVNRLETSRALPQESP